MITLGPCEGCGVETPSRTSNVATAFHDCDEENWVILTWDQYLQFKAEEGQFRFDLPSDAFKILSVLCEAAEGRLVRQVGQETLNSFLAELREMDSEERDDLIQGFTTVFQVIDSVN